MEERKKMAVEVRIQTAYLNVTEPQELYIEWHRGKQSIKTKKRSVDENIRKVVFAKSEAKFSIQASFFHLGNDQWKPDMNRLVLCIANQVIGTVHFDLAQYIGKQPIVEKARIVAESYQESNYDEHFLKGNAAEFPGTYIEFRLTVQTPEAAKAAAAANKKPKNPAKSAMSPSLTKSRAAALLATQQPGSGRLSVKPFGNAPWESRQVSIREEDEEYRRPSIRMNEPLNLGINEEDDEDDHGTVAQQMFAPDAIVADLEDEIKARVQVALEALRKEKQPKLDMQARCIAKYRATRDELQQRKTQMEQQLNQDVVVEKGQEKTYISDQRSRIASLFEQLTKEKKRKAELHQKVQAYSQIKQRLESSNGQSQEEKLHNLLQELKQQRNNMQNELDNSMSVKLHKMAYEIDFDAY